jgi:hypothetical protein
MRITPRRRPARVGCRVGIDAMTRRTHRFVALVLMLGTLFAQLAVAAFACPLDAGTAAATAMPAAHEGCGGAHAAQAREPAPADAALCGLHCQSAVSLPSTPAPPVALLSTVPLQVAVHDAALPADGGRDVRVLRTAMATAPPVSILYCRFQV